MYLGPVVAAQQALSPVILGKKRRGAHPLQPRLRSLPQGLGISLPHQGVLGKVFISFNLIVTSCLRIIKVVIEPLKGIVSSPSLGLGLLK